MDIIVREATLTDLGQIVRMQESHRKEISAYSRIRFSKVKCTQSMAVVINSIEHTVLVAHHEASSKLLGYIWMVAMSPHYSEDYYYIEQYTYIIPESRNGKVLAMFIKECKSIAIKNGAKYLNLGNLSGNYKLESAYAKRFELIGTVYNVNLGLDDSHG